MSIIEIITPLLTSITTMVGFWYKDRWDKRHAPGLADTTTRVQKIESILAEIQTDLDAFRIQEWVVSNGDKTLAGHSLQKLSIFAELNRAGVDSICATFQLVPATNLSRNLVRLAESGEGHIITQEHIEKDDLGALNSSYGVKTQLQVKINNLQGKWMGILCVCFDIERHLTNAEIAYVKLKASQIGIVDK